MRGFYGKWYLANSAQLWKISQILLVKLNGDFWTNSVGLQFFVWQTKFG